MTPLRILLLLYLIGVLAISGFSEKIGDINEVLKPQMIKVKGNELFVVERHKIYIYGLPELSLKAVLGKSGEGPGEFKLDPARTLIIHITDDAIYGESRYKLIRFDRKGRFVSEMKKNRTILQIIPVNNSFLVFKIDYGKGGENFFVLNLCDRQLNTIKQLYRQPFFAYKNQLHVMPDAVNYAVDNSNIFIERSPDGFLIDRFDDKGRLLETIKSEHHPIQISEAEKKSALHEYLNNPAMVNAKKRRGEAFVKSYLKSLKLIYPKRHPPIRYLSADHHRLYIHGSERKGESDRFYVYDLKERKFRSHFLPRPVNADFLVRMQGDKKFFTFHNQRYYYLLLNEENDTWELHKKQL